MKRVQIQNLQEEISETIERNYEEELYSLIGLNNVKKEVQKLLRTVEFNQKRLSEGLPIQEQSLHSVFTGILVQERQL